MAKKGDWVRIHRVVLEPSGRAENVPEDTKRVALEMWVKGHLTCDCNIGDIAEVITRTGRTETGELIEVNPQYEINFGDFVPELLEIDDRLRAMLFGGEKL
jgi:2-amino-4-ketopentanoate thiolase alpha subunit